MGHTYGTVKKCVVDFRIPRVRQFQRPFVVGAVCILVVFAGQACHNTNSGPAKTLTVIDQGWVGGTDYQRRLNEAVVNFTRQTGITVEFLPAPETTLEQIATWHKLLEGGANGPDVYGMDVIFPAIFAGDLLDLRPYIPEQEIAAHFPELITNNTVNGRLVALPAKFSEGVLFYRVDLLRKYGYRVPPKNWQELEVMARRIQAGERAKGNKNFWGFVWQGAPSEALTCNALEWQVSEGGGTIIDDKGNVTVNNPQAIAAWERAARWVGSISPPGVVTYKEWDALNLWRAGNAAFMRNWASWYISDRQRESPIKDRFDIAPLPRGSAGVAETLGGSGYGVSRHSLHPREAALLVRFLSSRDEQVRRNRDGSDLPTIPKLYDAPELLAVNPNLPRVHGIFRGGIALRPATPAGTMYPEVSRAYFEAVHAVLTHKESAAQAAHELQDQLQRMLKIPAVGTNADLEHRR
jgi:trehalose/maltose transport system substrate-binding protein